MFFSGALGYVEESTVEVGMFLCLFGLRSNSVKLRLLWSYLISPEITPVPIILADVSYVPACDVFKNNSHLRLAKLSVEKRSENLPPLIDLSVLMSLMVMFPVDVVKS